MLLHSVASCPAAATRAIHTSTARVPLSPLSNPTHPSLHPSPSPCCSAASFGKSYGATDNLVPAGSGAPSPPNGGGGGGSLRDPYAWAQRLRDIPDEDVLAELSLMGYTDGVGGRRGGGEGVLREGRGGNRDGGWGCLGGCVTEVGRIVFCVTGR